MAYTLSKLFREWAKELGLAQVFLATNGSTTTAVVGTFSDLEDPPEDNEFLDWRLVVDYDAGGAGAAPEEEWGRVSAYDSASYTFTVPTLTAAIAANDRFMVVNNTIPFQAFLSHVNDSLQKLGKIAYKDTSIPIVADTYRYNLPATVREITKIEWLDSDNIATEIPRAAWEVLPYTAGGTAVLDIKPHALPAAGYYLQIWHEIFHPNVAAYNAEISDTIEPALLRAQVVYDSLSALPQTSKLWQEHYAKAVGDLNAAIQRYGDKPKKPKKSPKILVIGDE